MYILYINEATKYDFDEFWAFKDIQNFTHNVIQLKWVEDLNDGIEHLAFMVNGDKLFAKHVATSELMDHVTWQALFNRVKLKCTCKLPSSSSLLYKLIQHANSYHLL